MQHNSGQSSLDTRAEWFPPTTSIPTEPGVYRFRDQLHRVLYVGKAKNLRSRLTSYATPLNNQHPRTATMLRLARSVEWTVVNTDWEAYQLEYTWIKEFDPYFNIRFRDDKSYPFIAVTLAEEFPKISVFRGERKPRVRYFGPYGQRWAARDIVDSLTKAFPVRTCSNELFKRHKNQGRPCFLGFIDRCAAPCTGVVSPEEYRLIVNNACAFLAGKTDRFLATMRQKMLTASENEEYEYAAMMRDHIAALEGTIEKQSVVLSQNINCDIAALAMDDLEVSIEMFFVRGGRIKGQQNWIVPRPFGDDPAAEKAEIWQDFLVQYYSQLVEQEQSMPSHKAAQATVSEESTFPLEAIDAASNWSHTSFSPIPKEIIIPQLPDNITQISHWLSQQRGSQVEVKTAHRGDKKTLLGTVENNAQKQLERRALQRLGDFGARSLALQELMTELNLPSAPLRIECVDISHLHGHLAVASLVVFNDGMPAKNHYRRFELHHDQGELVNNDPASIAQVTQRRFAKYQEQRVAFPGHSAAVPATMEAPTSFAYPPHLFIVDGGLAQVNAAHQALQELGITDVAVIGLAKRLEQVWFASTEYPVVLPRTSAALFLLQHIRDEAHRFAIHYHRTKRSKKMIESKLDSLSGVGPSRKTLLMKTFGSLAQLEKATESDISAIPGIGTSLARSIYEQLHQV